MIIKITQQQIDRTKPVSEGWHLFEIGEFAASDSKDKQSQNWVFDLVCVDKGEQNGRYSAARFNSKAPGMLISSKFLPSALDVPVDSEIEFDPASLKGKQLYGFTKPDVYEGKTNMKTEEFAPASQPPF